MGIATTAQSMPCSISSATVSTTAAAAGHPVLVAGGVGDRDELDAVE